jgi:hypothetical protein
LLVNQPADWRKFLFLRAIVVLGLGMRFAPALSRQTVRGRRRD